MARGPVYYPSKGSCIYCGARDVPLKDEHIVPFALGGAHVLRDASCSDCEKVTTRFERQVCRGLWGDARASFDAPTRREHPEQIEMTHPQDQTRTILIPASEYPGGFLFYKMAPCGFLQGLPDSEDLSAKWEMVIVDDEPRRKAFFEKYGFHAVLKFKHVPEDFGRLLAKIAHCQVLTALDPPDFRAVALPYVLGSKRNCSYIVGGTPGAPEPNNGYRLTTHYSTQTDRIILMVEIRLWATRTRRRIT